MKNNRNILLVFGLVFGFSGVSADSLPSIDGVKVEAPVKKESGKINIAIMQYNTANNAEADSVGAVKIAKKTMSDGTVNIAIMQCNNGAALDLAKKFNTNFFDKVKTGDQAFELIASFFGIDLKEMIKGDTVSPVTHVDSTAK